jgi:hypothetical protein
MTRNTQPTPPEADKDLNTQPPTVPAGENEVFGKTPVVEAKKSAKKETVVIDAEALNKLLQQNQEFANRLSKLEGSENIDLLDESVKEYDVNVSMYHDEDDNKDYMLLGLEKYTNLNGTVEDSTTKTIKDLDGEMRRVTYLKVVLQTLGTDEITVKEVRFDLFRAVLSRELLTAKTIEEADKDTTPNPNESVEVTDFQDKGERVIQNRKGIFVKAGSKSVHKKAVVEKDGTQYVIDQSGINFTNQ